jgi:hypothetical protein
VRSFEERAGDSEQAEMFARGLIAEPVDNGTLVLVPCVNPKTCPTHNPKLKKKEKESNA